VVGTAAAHVDLDVTAPAAARADRASGVQVPDPDLKPEVAVRQRAHRTDVHHVARILVVEVVAGEEADLRVVAAAEDPQLAGAGDLVAEAHAPRAQDAALGVQDHVGAQRHRLGLADLVLHHPRVVEPVLHVVDLEPALARLVADRAIEWVVDQVELHDGPARLLDPLGLRPHDHAVGGHRVAGNGRPRGPLDVHHAQAALPGDGESRMVAVVGHLHPDLAGRLDEVGAGGDLELLTVDRQLGHRLTSR
jgi:hypothetical protein